MTDVWVCGNCHSLNRQRASKCYKCGAAQKTAATGEMATHRQEQAIAMRRVVGYRPAAALGLAASIFLLALAAVAIAAMIDSRSVGIFLNQQLDVLKQTGHLDQAAFDALDARENVFTIVQLAVIVPLLVFFGAWLGRVVANVPALGGGIPGTTPGRAFVNTLIPFRNLRTVPGVIQDVSYRLDPKGGGFFLIAVAWIGLVGSWFISLVAGWYLTARIFGDIRNARSLDDAVEAARGLVNAAVVVDLVTGVLITAGALVLILVMIRIERRSRSRDAEVRRAAGV